MLTDRFKSAEATVDLAIARGQKPGASGHERWLTWSLLHNTHFRHRLTDQLARRA